MALKNFIYRWRDIAKIANLRYQLFTFEMRIMSFEAAYTIFKRQHFQRFELSSFKFCIASESKTQIAGGDTICKVFSFFRNTRNFWYSLLIFDFFNFLFKSIGVGIPSPDLRIFSPEIPDTSPKIWVFFCNFSDYRFSIFSGVGFRVSFRTERRTKTNARTAQTNVLLNAKYLNFPIRYKN